jgi:hypothetical protein
MFTAVSFSLCSDLISQTSLEYEVPCTCLVFHSYGKVVHAGK